MSGSLIGILTIQKRRNWKPLPQSSYVTVEREPGPLSVVSLILNVGSENPPKPRRTAKVDPKKLSELLKLSLGLGTSCADQKFC